ncbi:hypothetical protein QMK38_16060 [Lysinibacillus fusiformis]|nr:hypothetical protein [Lysinibacillus fusiformis]
MSIKKPFLYTLVFLIIVSILFFIGFKVINANNNELVLKEKNGELTLKESINLGLSSAKKWNKDAMFYKITSSDENRGGTRGDTGKRYDWNLFFTVPGTDKQLILGIAKGSIDFEHEVIGPDEPPIMLDDIKLDSPDLLKIVKDKYNLQKGEDWATGYHFTLDTIDDKPIVTVVGIDNDKLFTKISINPKNGKITGAIHKVPKGGELISLPSGTNTPKITKREMYIKGISSSDNSLVAWGDQKPTGINSTNQPFIELSNNNGESWNPLTIDENIVYAWFTSNKKLYIATESELLSIKNTEDKIDSILSLKTQIEGIDYSTDKIAILSNKNIYTTNDNGASWNVTSEPEPLLSLQVSNTGILIGLTQNRKVLLKSGVKWDTLKLSTDELEVSDLKVINNDILLLMDNEIWVYNLENERFNKFDNTSKIIQIIKKGSNLFGISEDGTIYLIDWGGDSFELKVNRLFLIENKIVADVGMTKNGLFIATIPDFIWEDIK